MDVGKTKPEAGDEWFNAYQEVDDFLFEALGEDFPATSENPVENTIAAIKLYAERLKNA